MTEPEAVRFIAEQAMGWTWEKSSLRGHVWINRPGLSLTAYWDNCEGSDGRSWNPFASPSDAFMVVDKMRELGYEISLNGMRREFWVSFQPLHSSRVGHQSKNVSAPTAICWAAIAALTGEGKEQKV